MHFLKCTVSIHWLKPLQPRDLILLLKTGQIRKISFYFCIKKIYLNDTSDPGESKRFFQNILSNKEYTGLSSQHFSEIIFI